MKNKLMKKLLCMLLTCMLLGLQLPALGEEQEPVSDISAWNFSVTYVEADSSFTTGVSASGFTTSLTLAAPRSTTDGFLGWGSLPNGEVQYQPGKPITLINTNPHAILYAIYGSKDDNLFSIYYVTGDNGRTEMFRSQENVYLATLSDAYADGFLGWAKTEGAQQADYASGSQVQLEPRKITLQNGTEFIEPSLTLYAVMEKEVVYTYLVHYYSGGKVETVEYTSPSVVAFITLESTPGVSGWSMIPGGEANFAPGAQITLQYNQPELFLYAAGEIPVTEPEIDDEQEVPPSSASDENIDNADDQKEPDIGEALEAPQWSSADESIATVDHNGLVTAVSPGTTIISVTLSGVTKSITVTVEGMCALCGAQNATHQVMDCGKHCEVQLTDKTHKLAPCGFEGGVYDSVTHEGHYDCDGLNHIATPISQYCDLPQGHQHTECWPDIVHFCDPANGGCSSSYNCWVANAHTICRMCGKLWCDSSDGGHETACGDPYHRPCQINQTGHYDEADHEICGYGCGSRLCDGQTHTVLDCGHCQQVSGNHAWCSHCKRFLCLTPNVSHGTGEGQCGYVPPIICTFCAAVGMQHDTAACGSHCVNQPGTHSRCDSETGCGGWLCNGMTHSILDCEHCQQVSGTHQECSHCGDWLCYTPDISHGTGEGQCGYVPPIICTFCAAVGMQHDTAACGSHCVNQPGTHSRCDSETGCGGWLCNGKTHSTLDCEHCQQVSGTHQECSHCGDWLCYTPDISHGTGEGQCGYVPPACSFCRQEGDQHTTAGCGNHCVNQSGEHVLCTICRTYYCGDWQHHQSCDHCFSPADADSHAFCTWCEQGYLCWEEHGEGLCSTQENGQDF